MTTRQFRQLKTGDRVKHLGAVGTVVKKQYGYTVISWDGCVCMLILNWKAGYDTATANQFELVSDQRERT